MTRATRHDHASALPLSRRGFLAAEAPVPPADPRQRIPVDLEINGRVRRIAVDPRSSLLDVLREWLGLTGTKKGCDHGQCGACTVHIAGRITGMNAAVANAVFHATGVRIRELPIRIEKLLVA